MRALQSADEGARVIRLRVGSTEIVAGVIEHLDISGAIRACVGAPGDKHACVIRAAVGWVWSGAGPDDYVVVRFDLPLRRIDRGEIYAVANVADWPQA